MVEEAATRRAAAKATPKVLAKQKNFQAAVDTTWCPAVMRAGQTQPNADRVARHGA